MRNYPEHGAVRNADDGEWIVLRYGRAARVRTPVHKVSLSVADTDERREFSVLETRDARATRVERCRGDRGTHPRRADHAADRAGDQADVSRPCSVSADASGSRPSHPHERQLASPHRLWRQALHDLQVPHDDGATAAARSG